MSAAGVCEVCGIDLDAHTVGAAEACTSLLVDPDCRDGKHTACAGDPCECECHVLDAPGVAP